MAPPRGHGGITDCYGDLSGSGTPLECRGSARGGRAAGLWRHPEATSNGRRHHGGGTGRTPQAEPLARVGGVGEGDRDARAELVQQQLDAWRCRLTYALWRGEAAWNGRVAWRGGVEWACTASGFGPA